MNILYIATSAFPGDSAYATRIDGISRALMWSGHKVWVLTDYSNKETGETDVDGICVVSGAKNLYQYRSILDKILARHRMLLNLKRILIENSIDCVIMSSIYMRVNSIIKIVHRQHIPVILESCEWFESYNWRKAEKSFEYKRFIYAWNNVFPKADGVIAISRMLEAHYKETVNNVVRIPTIMDIEGIEWRSEVGSHESIRLIFTGSIDWGKDRLVEVIEAIRNIDDHRIELHIYGPSREAVFQQLDENNCDITKNLEFVYFHGHVPHEEISKACKNADFGVIIRPDRRQSHAGFPTKIAEYMSVGTPVIANDTGDLSLYVNDSENGFCLQRNISIEDVENVLIKILSMSKEEMKQLRINARQVAQKSFDYRRSSELLNKLINSVVEEYKLR